MAGEARCPSGRVCGWRDELGGGAGADRLTDFSERPPWKSPGEAPRDFASTPEITDSLSIHHFGSGGSPQAELDRWAEAGTDLLLVPLQGHTRICDIALSYVERLRPKTVIPHHQDDFFPPISSRVDIEPFLDGMRRRFPGISVRIPSVNETFTL